MHKPFAYLWGKTPHLLQEGTGGCPCTAGGSAGHKFKICCPQGHTAHSGPHFVPWVLVLLHWGHPPPLSHSSGGNGDILLPCGIPDEMGQGNRSPLSPQPDSEGQTFAAVPQGINSSFPICWRRAAAPSLEGDQRWGPGLAQLS